MPWARAPEGIGACHGPLLRGRVAEYLRRARRPLDVVFDEPALQRVARDPQELRRGDDAAGRLEGGRAERPLGSRTIGSVVMRSLTGESGLRFQ